MDEGKLRKQAERGERAKKLLENELLTEAFDKIEGEILEGWKTSTGPESDIRERAYLMHRLLGNLKTHFNQVVTTGEAARSELLRIEDQSKLKRFMNGRR